MGRLRSYTLVWGEEVGELNILTYIVMRIAHVVLSHTTDPPAGMYVLPPLVSLKMEILIFMHTGSDSKVIIDFYSIQILYFEVLNGEVRNNWVIENIPLMLGCI